MPIEDFLATRKLDSPCAEEPAELQGFMISQEVCSEPDLWVYEEHCHILQAQSIAFLTSDDLSWETAFRLIFFYVCSTLIQNNMGTNMKKQLKICSGVLCATTPPTV